MSTVPTDTTGIKSAQPRRSKIIGPREKRMLLLNTVLYGIVVLALMWPDLASAVSDFVG